MLKYLVVLPLLIFLLFRANLTAEPETPQYMAARAFEDALVIAEKRAALEAEAKAHELAVLHLVNYLERKWKQPRNELMEAVTLSFHLTSNSSSSSHMAWPQPLDVLAIIQVESGFNRQARDSQSGSVGLMQINADDHKIAVAKLIQPAVSIHYGVGLLRKYKRELRTETQALVAYNMGPANAIATCPHRAACSTEYTRKVALAKEELTRHFN